jgi:hypothetical protein
VRAGSGGEGGAAGAAGDASPARGGAGAAICGAAVHHAGRGDQRETLRQADNAADKRGGGAIIAGAASFASAIASPPSGTWPRQHTTNSNGGEAGKESGLAAKLAALKEKATKPRQPRQVRAATRL